MVIMKKHADFIPEYRRRVDNTGGSRMIERFIMSILQVLVDISLLLLFSMYAPFHSIRIKPRCR